ncbi:hypothetical protein PO656_21470, partial [Enterobacter kobei]
MGQIKVYANSCSLADERRWDQFINSVNYWFGNIEYLYLVMEGANKQVISSQADSLIKISRIWADF